MLLVDESKTTPNFSHAEEISYELSQMAYWLAVANKEFEEAKKSLNMYFYHKTALESVMEHVI